MSTSTITAAPVVEYPETDGLPMAENTKQFRWIVTIEGGLEAVYAHREDVFVAGDLFWYPVEGDSTIRIAADIMVVFGRPKGDRSSYLQWRENGVAPKVTFEILSPGNTKPEMQGKLEFYEEYGVEEYYIYDPEKPKLSGWRRQGRRLKPIPDMSNWTSPSLGIRFDMSQGELRIYGPDGQLFATYQEAVTARDQERKEKEKERAAKESERAAKESERAAKESERAAKEVERAAKEKQRERADRLAAQLRALGIEPEE